MLFSILLSALDAIFLSDLAEKLGYSKRDKFKEMYIDPLMKDGFLVIPISPIPQVLVLVMLISGV